VGTLLGPERTGMGVTWKGFSLRVSFSGLHLFPHQPACRCWRGVWVGVSFVV